MIACAMDRLNIAVDPGDYIVEPGAAAV